MLLLGPLICMQAYLFPLDHYSTIALVKGLSNTKRKQMITIYIEAQTSYTSYETFDIRIYFNLNNLNFYIYLHLLDDMMLF